MRTDNWRPVTPKEPPLYEPMPVPPDLTEWDEWMEAQGQEG